MKQIPVKVPHTTVPVYATIDDDDYELVSPYRWYLNPDGCAMAYIYGEHRALSMHRLVMGEPEGLVVDHIHHNRLDNQKSELRACTNQQNTQNSYIPKHNTTGYKGVGLVGGKWRAIIRHDGRIKSLGTYNTKIEAAEAYNRGAEEFFGEYACINGHCGEGDDLTNEATARDYAKLQTERLTLKSPLMAIASKEIRRAVHAAIKKLTYRENQIICLRYGIADGFIYTLEEISKIFKVTKQRVQQLEAKAIQKLKFSLGAVAV